MTTWITICETCKREGWEAGERGTTDGEALAERVERLLAAEDVKCVRTRRHPCLMGCSQACNVALQSEGKIAYTLGRFEPTEDCARGIVDFAQLHSQSATGQVPYRTWPEPIKGHFVTRHPPLPKAP